MNEVNEVLENVNDTVPELPHLLTFVKHFVGGNFAEFLEIWDDIIFSVFIASLISILFYLGVRNAKLIPRGFQSFLESVVELLRDLVVGILGHNGEKYLPLLGTIFIYIFCMNIAGMIPFMKSPSTSLNITAAMAICVFVLVQFLNFRNHGFLGFMYHLAGSPKTGVEWMIVPLMFPIEIIVQLSRPVTLALRLFGNILGEDILIAAFAVFGISMVASFSPVGIPLQLPFMFLGLLTSLMQALVFTLLSTVYIMLSMPHHDEVHTHKQLEE